jgi:WD40 repeat protein
MNYIYCFCMLFFAQGLCAMERELATPITNPTHVLFLDSKNIAIAGSNGFCFFNTKTNKTVYCQQDQMIEDFCTNKSKSKVATSSKGVIRFFDVNTRKQEWEYNTQEKDFAPITFNSQQVDELFVKRSSDPLLRLQNGKVIKTYNIITPNINDDTIIPFHTPITCHPRKAYIIGIVKIQSKQHSCHEAIYAYDVHSSPEFYRCLLDTMQTDLLYSMEYSSDGIYNTINMGKHGLKLETTNKFKRFSFSDISTNFICVGSAFHPNDKILATVSMLENGYSLQYWDCEKVLNYTKIIPSFPPAIAEIPLQDDVQSNPITDLGKRCTFSPDGKHILIALQNKCLIRSVILDTMYQRGTKEALMPIVWALGSTAEKEEGNAFLILPYDIINIIKNMLLDLCRVTIPTLADKEGL